MKEDAQANKKTTIRKTGVSATLRSIFVLAIVCACAATLHNALLISIIGHSASSQILLEEKSIRPDNTSLPMTILGTSTRAHTSSIEGAHTSSIEEDNKSFLRAGNIIAIVGDAPTVQPKIEANKTNNTVLALLGNTADDDHETPKTSSKLRLHYPSPRLTNSSVFIFVLSRRDAFATRQIIRETWASGQDNVYFMIGAGCNVPPELRIDDWTCEENVNASVQIKNNNYGNFYKVIAKTEAFVRKEMTMYRDILLDQDYIDSYRSLPAKVKTAYTWGINNLPQALWFVKVDDDMYLRVGKLVSTFPKGRTFQSNFRHFMKPEEVDQNVPHSFDATKDAIILSGSIYVNHTAHKTGKWKEIDEYKPSVYPTFPGGNSGHIISRALANYIAENSKSLVNYQGEDVSLGIWADQAPMNVTVLRDQRLKNTWRWNDVTCVARAHIVGHKLKAKDLRKCYWIDQEKLKIGKRQE
jgi:hypothetical protein